MKKLQTRQNISELVKIHKLPKNELEIEQLVLDDMRSKIINDEMNEISFYEIQPIESKSDLNFRSTHFFQDLALIRGTKFHQKIKWTPMEQRLRHMIASEPGNLLLMREIYEKYEENIHDRVSKQKLKIDREMVKTSDYYKPQNDEQIIANLDTWQKQLKKKQEEKKLQQQQQEEEQIAYQRKSRPSLSMIPVKKRFSTAGDLLHRLSVKRFSVNAFGLKFPEVQKQDSKEEESKRSEEQKDENEPIRNLFKSKTLQNIRKSISPVGVFNEGQHSVNKKIEKYLNQGQNLTVKDFEKLDYVKAHKNSNNNFIFDYSTEGLKRSLHTLIKMQITSFNNAHERAQFYEKQSNQIFNAINDKIQEQEQLMEEKRKFLDSLRLENHQIYDNQRQIKNLTVQLNEDLRQVSLAGKEQKLLSKAMLSGNRSTQIENYMQIANRQKEIEDQIQSLKDSSENYAKKTIFNNKNIEQIENEIIRLQKNNKQLKKSMESFLLELLNVGLDCRNIGLVWIIKKLWSFGDQIMINHFPNFLDSKSRQFLLKKTKKIISLEKIIVKSHEHFMSYKKQINDQSFSSINVDCNILFNKIYYKAIPIQNSFVSISTFHNSFASMNPQQLRVMGIYKNKVKQMNEIELLLTGVTQEEKRCIDRAFNELNTSKETANDIVYNEAKRKIQVMYKESTSKSDTQNNEELALMKERMINEYADLQKLRARKEQKLIQYEENELDRIIKEIEYKNYLKRFNVEPLQLIAALFGYQKAERELIKNGMLKK